jgi:hypothetical protein
LTLRPVDAAALVQHLTLPGAPDAETRPAARHGLADADFGRGDAAHGLGGGAWQRERDEDASRRQSIDKLIPLPRLGEYSRGFTPVPRFVGFPIIPSNGAEVQSGVNEIPAASNITAANGFEPISVDPDVTV